MNPDDDRTQRPPPHPDSVNPAMGGDDAGPDARGNDTSSGLQMPPDLMLDLARQAAELLVGRIQDLPGDIAWDGEFRQELLDQLMEDPPEEGRPGADVLERAARDVLPLTLRLDHPRSFAFVPTAPTWPGVLADFIAAGYNINACTWLVASGPSQLELVVIDWFRRWLGYPEGAGGLFTSGGSAASLDAFVAAREAAGHPERGTAPIPLGLTRTNGCSSPMRRVACWSRTCAHWRTHSASTTMCCRTRYGVRTTRISPTAACN